MRALLLEIPYITSGRQPTRNDHGKQRTQIATWARGSSKLLIHPDVIYIAGEEQEQFSFISALGACVSGVYSLCQYIVYVASLTPAATVNMTPRNIV